jgi:DNA-binding transcriptional regulator YdaS (Cro superfamily)
VTKKEAVKLFGNKRALAEKLGISVQAVNAWKEKQIPKLREYQINEQLKKVTE